MLLRLSSQQEHREVNLNSVTEASQASGVLHGEHLAALTEAAIKGDWLALGELNTAARAAMGQQQVVDCLIVAAAFNGITRVADATGIPLDEATAQQTETLRQETGITRFDYAAKTARYDGEQSP